MYLDGIIVYDVNKSKSVMKFWPWYGYMVYYQMPVSFVLKQVCIFQWYVMLKPSTTAEKKD